MQFLATVTWDDVTDWLLEHGTSIFLVLLGLAVAQQMINKVVPLTVRQAMARQLAGRPLEEIQKRADTVSHVAQRTLWLVAVVLAVLTILPELNVNIAPLLAGVSISGIAIGFAAQSLLRDIINGFFILAENQYAKGDTVRLMGISGTVEEVSLRRTVLRDLDGVVHSISNGEIRVSSNFTKEWSRVNLNVTVAYGQDLEKVFRVINRVGKELAEDPQFGPVIIDPPHVLRIDAFEDSGIAIKIMGDTHPTHQWDVMGELRRRLMLAFSQEGIEMKKA